MPSTTDPILLHLGPFIIRWYGLLIVSGALVAAYVATTKQLVKKRARNPLTTTFHPLFLYESLWNLLGFGLAMGLGRKVEPQKGRLTHLVLQEG